jgi:branched-subunit amino acid transport protein AzlD
MHTATYIVRAIFLLLFGIVFITYDDYGVTWDEQLHQDYGYYIWHFYLSLGQDLRAAELGSMSLYGAIYDLITYPFSRLSFLGDTYESRHFANALFGLLGIFAAYKIATLLRNQIAGIIAVLCMALTPCYYGHMFNNPKDIPFAVAYLWSVYFLLKWSKSPLSISLKDSLFLSLALAFTFAVRIAGLIISPVFILVPVYGLFLFYLRKEPALNYLVSLLKLGGVIFCVSLAVIILFWPYILLDPVNHITEVLTYYLKGHSVVDMQVLFSGVMYRANTLPSYYVLESILVKIPIPIILFFLTGIALFLNQLIRLKTDISNFIDEKFPYLILLLSSLFPLFYISFSSSSLYDGIRHVLFTIPPLVIVSAIGLNDLMEYLKKRKVIFFSVFSVLVIYCIFHIAILVRLHPYQYIYHNQFTNGVSGAYMNYELDYWGHSYREAVAELDKHIGVNINEKVKVFVAGPEHSAVPYFKDYMELVDNVVAADYIITFTRYNWHHEINTPGKIIKTIYKMGVPLCYIKEKL